MSLKLFHILFVIAATLLCAGFGLWSLDRHMDGQPGPYLIMSMVSLVGAVALGIYGRIFLHKTKDVSFL